MHEPLVSIVIPCFDAERYVGDAIRSALDQTYRKREVIVIDDGSTDGSLDVIRSFGNALRWETGPPRGGGAARNRGLALARGDLVQFLDADDYLHSEKLERQVRCVVRNPARIVYCDYETQWEEGDAGTSVRSPHYDDLDPVVFVASKAGLQTAAPLHWRDALVKVKGFNEELACAQERDLHLRLAAAGWRFYHLPEVLLTVRRRSWSVSGDAVRILDQHSGIVWRVYELLEESGALTEQRCAGLAGFLASDARAYLRHGLAAKARDYFEQAHQIHSDGGIQQAYSNRTRWLVYTLGPVMTEHLVRWKRALTTTLSR